MKSSALALTLILTLVSICAAAPAYAEDEAVTDTEVTENVVDEEPGRGGEEVPTEVDVVDDGSIPDEIMQNSAGGPEVQRDNSPEPVALARLETSREGLDAGDWLAQLRKKKRK